LGIGRRARLASTICEAIILWPVIAIWGHPEDPLAMAFAIWGLVAALRGRWRTVGWFWGLAFVMQPLVVLMFPIVFALAPRRQRPSLAVRSALPSAVLVAIPLLQSWGPTANALFKQPNFPTINHATPWLALAPVLTKAQAVTVAHAHRTVLANGAVHFGISYSRFMYGEVVAAGPGRLIALGLAVLLGVYVYRRRPSPDTVVWLCCVALALRCFFEAVMDPYYLWPPLALAFVLVVRNRWRFVVAVTASAGLTQWSYRHMGPWQWWAPIVILLAVVVIAARPMRVPEPAVTQSDWPAPDRQRRAVEALV
jgi:hypothetical protein